MKMTGELWCKASKFLCVCVMECEHFMDEFRTREEDLNLRAQSAEDISILFACLCVVCVVCVCGVLCVCV